MQMSRPKILTGSILAVLMALSGVVSPAHADPPAPGVEEKLPMTPPPPPSVPNYGTTFLPDGTPVAVMVSGGSGGLVNLIDLNTAKPVDTPQILASEGVDAQPWGFARMSDNSVLIGASNNLYRYDPGKPRANRITMLSEVGKDGFTEELQKKMSFVWDIALDDSGTAYIATSNKETPGTVLTYKDGVGWGLLEGADPVDPEETYARSIDHDDGKLYVTVGPVNPRLFVFDLSRPGSKEVIALPEAVAKKGEHLPYLEVHSGIAYVGHSDGSGTTALNLATGEHEFWDKVTSNVIPRPDEPRRVTYWKKLEGQSARLVEYDPDTGQHTDLLVDNSLLRRIAATSWVTHDLFVSTEMNGGRISIHRAGEARSTMHSGLVIPMRREIGTLTVTESGDIHGGWYMAASKLLQVTPATRAEDTTYTLHDAPVGQIEGTTTHGDHLVSGLYGGARISFRSLSDMATYEKKPPSMWSTPSKQDRPYAVIHTTGDQFALGSVPESGHLGGALALVDAKAKAIETDPVTRKPAIYPFKELKNAEGQVVAELADQAPVSLAHRDGKLYIGTTIRGGHSDRAKNPDGSLQEAHLVEFDLAKRVVTRIMNPFPGKGQRAVAALTWGENGMLHGATGSHAFTVDPASFTVTNSRVMKGSGELVNRTWLLHHEGELFGVFGGSLYAFSSDLKGEPLPIAVPIELKDPTRSDEAVRLPVGSPVIGKDKFLYYTRGPEIYRHSYLLAKSGPAPQGQASAAPSPSSSPSPSVNAPARPSTPVAPVPRPGLPKTGAPR